MKEYKMKVSQTKLELLENTIAYYSEDTSRRALEDGTCQYLTDSGNKCAIGREVRTHELDDIKNQDVSDIHHLLPYRLKRMGLSFLMAIQHLHDTNHYWDANGLTTSGKSKVSYVKTKFIL